MFKLRPKVLQQKFDHRKQIAESRQLVRKIIEQNKKNQALFSTRKGN